MPPDADDEGLVWSGHGAILRDGGKRRANAPQRWYGRPRGSLDFLLLGSLEVREGGVALNLGGLRERSLLAILLLNANELVPTDRLVDELWGDAPPKAAVKTVQVYVSRLRKLLGTDAIITRTPGYELRVAPERIDAGRFEGLAADGR